MSSSREVVIVGGGFSGAMVAVHTLRLDPSARVTLIDREGRFARGVAYSTTCLAHLLNVHTARMSAFPDDPEHLLRWVRVHHDANIAPDSFIPRAHYGEYLRSILEEAQSAEPSRIRLLRDSVALIEHSQRPRVYLKENGTIEADAVVLALGHSLPRDPWVSEGADFYSSPRYIRDAWSDAASQIQNSREDVLIIGSGLTMYDIALSLIDRGHQGTIHAVSRRALLPRVHADRPLNLTGGPSPSIWLEPPTTARELLRRVRRVIDTSPSIDWRAVIDSIRPVTAAVWKSLPERERTRFLSHVRPFWEVHRHRAAVQIDRRIQQLIDDETLVLHRGPVRAWKQTSDGVIVELPGRTLRVGHVINCTGPDSDVERSNNPLVRTLLEQGLIKRDAHGLGVETADNGAVIDAQGQASSWLYTLGTWRKPALWESVAVPELRAQALELAKTIARQPQAVPHER